MYINLPSYLKPTHDSSLNPPVHFISKLDNGRLVRPHDTRMNNNFKTLTQIRYDITRVICHFYFHAIV